MVSRSTTNLLRALCAALPALLAPAARGAPQAGGLPMEPDLESAVIAAHRAFEAAVFAHAGGGAHALIVEPRQDGAGVDPLRTALAVESFAALLERRGAAVRIATSGEPVRAAAGAEPIALGVTTRDGSFALELCGGAGSTVLASSSICVPFAEKEWVGGRLPASERFEHLLRGEGIGVTASAAREAARAAVASRVIELLPQVGDLDPGHLAQRLASWELDRFESSDAESGSRRCAILVGLDAERRIELESAAASERRAASLAWGLKGTAGCLWLALCVMLCARADLATRGYLTWTWRGLFTLAFAAGVAVLAAWR